MNSPHNPTGKVFSVEDLSFIADLCQKWNVYAILDEVSRLCVGSCREMTAARLAHLASMSSWVVNRHFPPCNATPDHFPVQVYEHLVFKGSRHVSMRSLSGMRERCIRIGSAGKTFSLTAWKVRCSGEHIPVQVGCTALPSLEPCIYMSTAR